MKERIPPVPIQVPTLDSAIKAEPETILGTSAQSNLSLGPNHPTTLATNRYFHLISLAVFRRLHRFIRGPKDPFQSVLRLASAAARKYTILLATESKGALLWNSIMEKDHPSAIAGHDTSTMDQAMAEMIARWPARQREIFLMRYTDRIPYPEIAKIRGEPSDEVLQLLTSAYRQVESWT